MVTGCREQSQRPLAGKLSLSMQVNEFINEAGLFQCQRQDVNCLAASKQSWDTVLRLQHTTKTWQTCQSLSVALAATPYPDNRNMPCRTRTFKPYPLPLFPYFIQQFFPYSSSKLGAISSAERMRGVCVWSLQILEKDNRLTDGLPNGHLQYRWYFVNEWFNSFL